MLGFLEKKECAKSIFELIRKWMELISKNNFESFLGFQNWWPQFLSLSML